MKGGRESKPQSIAEAGCSHDFQPLWGTLGDIPRLRATSKKDVGDMP